MPIFLLALVLTLTGPVAAAAQDPLTTPPTEVNLLAIGGFLGQLDGFCEQPGGTYDAEFLKQPDLQGCADKDGRVNRAAKPAWPVTLGGLLGGKTWIEREKKTGSPIVVISGNNQVANFTFLDESMLLTPSAPVVDAALTDPKRTRREQTDLRFRRFWQEMAALDADAIGLGPEDFVRSLRDPRDTLAPTASVRSRPSIFYRWLQQITAPKTGPRLIGSNAIVKLRRNGVFSKLNLVENGGYSLAGIDDEESAGWLSEITVNHPARAGITLTLYEDGDTGKPVGSAVTDKETTSTRLRPTDGVLKPGHTYEVRATEKSESTPLRFQTHRALTPRVNPGPLNEYPVVARDWIDGSPLLIVSLVDPAVKSLVGKDAWAWAGPGCPEDACEIDFLSPVAAMQAIVHRAFPDDRGRKPLIVLLSSLSDTQTQEVLEAFPEVRVTVLPQESYMLGRSARAYLPAEDEGALADRLGRRAGRPAFSGDLGLSAIISGDESAATHIAVRPEWLGETAARISARMQYTTRLEWELDDERAAVTLVPGAALEWRPAPCPPNAVAGADCTEFSMQWEGRTIPYGPFESYQVCEMKAPSDRCTRFAELAEQAQFDVFAGDALRRATGAELAIVPGTLVDPDHQTWLSAVVDATHTRVMTRFALERIIYRSLRIVRTEVAGDTLVATLDKALKAAAYGESCVVGLGGDCRRSVNTKAADKIVINGRLIDARQYYSIAMPAGMAQELELAHAEGRRHTTDAVSALHQRLSLRGDDGWYVAGPEGDSVAKRIVEEGNARLQHHQIWSSFELGYTEIALTEPVGQLPIKKTEIDFRGVTPSRTVLTKANIDAALLDRPKWALRAVTEIDYKRRVDTRSAQRAIDNNTWMAGARLDRKWPFAAREFRTYAGYFWEGELAGPKEYYTAVITRPAENGFTLTKKAPGLTTFTRDPLHYQYWGFGVDVLNLWKVFSEGWLPIDLTKATLQYALGRRHSVPIGARVAGVDQPDDKYAQGLQQVLDNYFDTHEAAFTPGISFTGIDESRDQQRLQGEFNFEPRLVLGSKTFKFGTELRGRFYPHVADTGDNSVKIAIRAKVSISLPITRRLELVPAYEYQAATIHQEHAQRYTQSNFQVTFKFPFVVKTGWLGWGWLLR